MKKANLFIILLSLLFWGCSKKYTLPESSAVTRISLGKILFPTPFLDYATSQTNKNIDLAFGLKNRVQVASTGSLPDSISTWQHVFGGKSLIQYTPVNPSGTVIIDSVDLNNPSLYSRTIFNGTYNISLMTKPTTHLADSFIRFTALDSSFVITKSIALGFSGITKDGLITINSNYVKSGTAPLFETSINGTPVTYKFGLKNGYFFLYVLGQIKGTVSLTSNTNLVLTKYLIISSNTQYNLAIGNTSQLGPVTLSFLAFHLNQLLFDNTNILSDSIKNGLIGYYRFMGNFLDSSGTNNNGILVNNATFQPDRFGETDHAIRLNSSNDIIATTNAFSDPENFSYSFWFKTGASGQFIGFNNGQEQHGGIWDRVVFLDQNGLLNYYVYDGTNHYLKTSISAEDNQWHHCAVTQSGVGAKIYLDGIQVALDLTIKNAQNSTGYFRIGGIQSGSNNNPSLISNVGSISEVRIYNRVLSSNEIGYLYLH